MLNEVLVASFLLPLGGTLATTALEPLPAACRYSGNACTSPETPSSLDSSVCDVTSPTKQPEQRREHQQGEVENRMNGTAEIHGLCDVQEMS